MCLVNSLSTLFQPQTCPKWSTPDTSLFLTKHKPEKHLPPTSILSFAEVHGMHDYRDPRITEFMSITLDT